MRPGTFDWPPQYAGDTVRPYQFLILENDEPVAITGCTIRMQVRASQSEAPILDLSSAVGASIVITDGPNGAFRVGNFRNPQTCGSFTYDLEVTFPDGRVQTYFRGSYVIEGDITR